MFLSLSALGDYLIPWSVYVFCKLVKMAIETFSDALETTVGCTLDASTAQNYLCLKNVSWSIGFSLELPNK